MIWVNKAPHLIRSFQTGQFWGRTEKNNFEDKYRELIVGSFHGGWYLED